MTLADLPKKTDAIIVSSNTELQEHGFRYGDDIRVLMKGNSLIAVKLHGTTLALSDRDARKIIVRKK